MNDREAFMAWWNANCPGLATNLVADALLSSTWLAAHDREVEQSGRRAGLQEAIDIIGGEDPSGGMVSVTYLIRELYELINEPEPAGVDPVSTQNPEADDA